MIATTPGSHGEALAAALAALRSAEPLVQNQGVDAAIRLGATAVPGLLKLLDDPGAARGQIMYALSEIADPRARAAFAAAGRDSDKSVRAYAARGLARIGDAQALPACLLTIDDAPDALHLDRTPSVEALGDMGLAAVPALLDLLLDGKELTRLHAQRALEEILARRHGFHPGAGFPTPEAEAAMRAEWRANGDYDYAGAADDRVRAVAKWREWLRGARP